MNQQLLNTFLKENYFLPQIKSRLKILKNHLSVKFFNSQPEILQPDDKAWLDSLGEDFFKYFNSINLSQTIEFIEQEVKKIQPLTIFTGFDMPDNEKNKLGVWLRQNLSLTVTFETRIDPDLIGGCALSFRGIYRDFSLRQKIEGQKPKILSSFQNFLK